MINKRTIILAIFLIVLFLAIFLINQRININSLITESADDASLQEEDGMSQKKVPSEKTLLDHLKFIEDLKDDFLTNHEDFLEINLDDRSIRLYRDGELTRESEILTSGDVQNWGGSSVGLYQIKSKNRAREIYSKIGRVECPALSNDSVSFSRIGFNHLIRKGRIPRTRNEQKRRFVLIPYVEEIVKNPEARIIYREKTIKYKANRHGEKIIIESQAKFWAFMENIEFCRVKVIIRQLGDGDKHFFSVISNDVRIDNKNKKSPKN